MCRKRSLLRINHSDTKDFFNGGVPIKEFLIGVQFVPLNKKVVHFQAAIFFVKNHS